MEHLLNKKIFDVEESLIRKFNNMAKANGAELILTLGEPDFATPDIIKDACIKALNADKTKYGMTPGNLDFRQKVCEFEERVNQIKYMPEEVTITTGSTEALTAALMTMLNPGDEVVILTPAYPLYKNITGLLGGVIVPIDVSQNKFQLTKEMLDAAITDRTKVIILTSPNNPTGAILNDESLELVYEAQKIHEFFVISDECYNQLVYSKRQLGFSKYQDIRDYIVVCQSFSKPYAMPGWRIGYMLASKAFTEQARKIHQYMVIAANTFIQDAGIAALDYDPSDMTESYRLRRDYVYGRLVKMGIEVELPEGAFYMFPSIKKFGLGSWEFCTRLADEEKVALVPGVCFDADDFIRISYCVDQEVIVAAMDRLEAFINRL
ncbi:MAG: aminotransferase class I/II-fold pyridoxal phosphate-dependent enzyme [Turicibacter sp.]|nr:aminotransferase class I/II-fold pyridoxal phosphate-dependent enzyme [Turicibacter sp.]